MLILTFVKASIGFVYGFDLCFFCKHYENNVFDMKLEIL